MRPLPRVLVVGQGPWGRKILETLKTLPADGHGCTRDWALRLAHNRPDAVVIASPAVTHGEIALACLDRRIPVFIEKPLTISPETAQQIRNAAARASVPAFVDHIDLFNPAFLAFALRLRAPVELYIELAGPGPYRPDLTAVWDYGAHGVAMAMHCFGWARPAEVRVDTVTAASAPPHQARLISLTFPPRGRARILIDNHAEHKVRRAQVLNAANVKPYDGLEVDPGHPELWPLTGILRRFIRDVVEHSVTAHTGTDIAAGLAVVEILERCGPP